MIARNDELTRVDGALACDELPYAIVRGTPITELPADLYIPPNALEVLLETFEGPLDLLLYLIRRENLDVLDIPVAKITQQYMRYIEMMQELRLELAADYLVMAAMLAEIKSRMLLPQHEIEEEEDPRAELVRRLQEYERYKQAAEELDALPRMERELFGITVGFPSVPSARKEPEVSLDALLRAMCEVLERSHMFCHHHVPREPLSVRERMTLVLERISIERFSEFSRMFTVEEGRAGVVVTLLAILELLKGSLIELVQSTPYGAIYVKAAT